MPDRLPPLRLTAAERMFLAAELDLAALGYEDAAYGQGTVETSMVADARRLRRLAARMRGGPAEPFAPPGTRSVPLAELPLSEHMMVPVSGMLRRDGGSGVCMCGYQWGAAHAPVNGHAHDCPMAGYEVHRG